MTKNPYEGFASPVGGADNPYAGFASPVAESPQGDDTPSFAQNLGRGTGQAALGVMNSVDKFMPDNAVGRLGHTYLQAGQDYVKKGEKYLQVDDDTYGPSAASRLAWNSPSSWAHAAAEGLPGILGAAGVGAMTGGAGFTPMLAAENFGNTLDQRMANQGGAAPTWKDYVAAGGSSLVQAELGRMGLGKLTSPLSAGFGAGLKGLTKLPIDLAGAAATGGATSAAGDVVDQIGRNLGTSNGPSQTIDPSEVAKSALAGATTNPIYRGIQGGGDLINSGRMAGLGGKEAQASADVAGRFDRLRNGSGVDLTNPDALAQAHGVVKDSLVNDLKDSAPMVKDATENNLPLKKDIALATSTLVRGLPIKESDISDISGRLGSQGDAFAHTLRSMNVQNKVAGMSGGAANSKIAQAINPASFVSSPGSHGAGADMFFKVAGMGELVHTLGIGHLGAGMGAAALLRPVFHGIDKLTGLPNPTQEFTNRFVNSAPTFQAPPPPPPPAAPPEMQGPGTPSNPLPNSALAQIAKNRMELEQANQPAPAPEPQGPGAFSPLPNSALAQIAKNRMELENQAALQPEANADNRAFDTQQRSAATAQDKLRTFLQKAAAVKAAQAGLNGPSPTPQAPAAPSGLVVRSNGTGGTFNPDASAPGAPLTTITNGKYSTQRDLSTVANRPGYTAAVQKALGARAGLGADLEKIAPNKTPEIEGFVNRMNNQSKSFQDASEHFEALVNDHLPASAQKAAFDAWNAHEAKIRGTFKQ